MMSARSAVVRVGQVCLVLLVAGLLWHWWRVRPAAVVSDDAVDDLIEEVGDTYVSVHVGEIQRGTLRQYVTAYGVAEPAAASAGQGAASARVGSSVTATAATVNCSEGEMVKKGQTLFTLDSRLADTAIAQAQQVLVADQMALDALGKLNSTTQPSTQPWQLVAERQLGVDQANLERAKSDRDRLTVVAPIAGTVTNLAVSAGQTIDPKTTVVEIVDLDRLVAAVDVPAGDLAELHAGQPAELALRSGDSTTQPAAVVGNVVLIDPSLNPSTGMGSVDVSLPKDSGLRPGQFVSARIVVGEENDRLMVPTQSITQNGNDDPAVGRVETDGRWAVLVPVRIGWRDGDKTEIEGEGLDAGQQVVTGGANGLVQRTRLHLLRD